MPIPQLHRKSSTSWREYRGSRGLKPAAPKIKKSLIRKLLPPVLFLVAAFIIISVIYIAWVSRNLPNPNQLINREVAQSTKIYDRTGQHILYEISGNQKKDSGRA